MWEAELIALELKHERRIERLEHRMTQTDDLIARIAATVNKLATDIHTLQDGATNGDTITAAKLQPIADALDALDALTPDPVVTPPADPTPADPTEPPADAPPAV